MAKRTLVFVHCGLWRDRQGLLDDLLHVDAQKSLLVQNTLQLLAGLPANNALLWGARGTGKSSLVHGVLNAYAQEGLRLVEVGKDALADLAEVIEGRTNPITSSFFAMTCLSRTTMPRISR